MKKLQQNPFLAGLAIAAIVILGGVGYYSFQSFGIFIEERERYDRQVQTLHRLQNASPYPSAENLATVQAAVEEYRQKSLDLEATVRQHQVSLSEVTPNQFQDELRHEVSALTTKAAEAKVELPADFYLGFNEFQTGLPTNTVPPFLARQLGLFRSLADILIDAGINRIDLWQRLPIPVEKDPENATFPVEPTPEQIVRSSPLVLGITGEQLRVRRALNDIFRSPKFFIIRSLEVVNSSREAPSKAASQAEWSGETSAAPTLTDLFETAESSTPAEATPQDLPIVLGRETVTIRLRLEFLEFAPLTQAEQPTQPTQP